MTFREGLDRGLAEFQAGRFYEAHELWERAWAEETGSERQLLKGLVQAAAGYHKAEIGVPAGARKLFAMALESLTGLAGDAFGLDLEAFRQELGGELARLAGSPPAEEGDR